jgi:hypothetical protein
MEEFEVALDEEELNVLGGVLEKEHPGIPPEKLEKIRRKIEDISKLVKRGEFDLRVRKAERKP